MADGGRHILAAGRALSVLLLVAALVAAGCAKKSERLVFNGNYYPTKADKTDKAERQRFAVAVRRVDQGIAGAREAGRHAGKQYCLKNFGTSEIDWIVGPDTPGVGLDSSNGRLVLTGTCVLW